MKALLVSDINDIPKGFYAELAYKIVKKTSPAAIDSIKDLLRLGKTPTQIADTFSGTDVFLAALVEEAANYLKEKEVNHVQNGNA